MGGRGHIAGAPTPNPPQTRCFPPGEHSGQRARERPAGSGRAQPGHPPAAALRRPPPLTTDRADPRTGWMGRRRSRRSHHSNSSDRALRRGKKKQRLQGKGCFWRRRCRTRSPRRGWRCAKRPRRSSLRPLWDPARVSPSKPTSTRPTPRRSSRYVCVCMCV